MPQFTHLHLHSEYSLLDGSNRMDRLLDQVKQLGMDSVAVTDHGNLYGAAEFQKAARMGIKSIAQQRPTSLHEVGQKKATWRSIPWPPPGASRRTTKGGQTSSSCRAKLSQRLLWRSSNGQRVAGHVAWWVDRYQRSPWSSLASGPSISPIRNLQIGMRWWKKPSGTLRSLESMRMENHASLSNCSDTVFKISWTSTPTSSNWLRS